MSESTPKKPEWLEVSEFILRRTAHYRRNAWRQGHVERFPDVTQPSAVTEQQLREGIERWCGRLQGRTAFLTVSGPWSWAEGKYAASIDTYDNPDDWPTAPPTCAGDTCHAALLALTKKIMKQEKNDD